ncbi:hypothetical protein NECAME_04270 [Necator americanus]|uniref:Uncharacterized protein n=1 Tax=Necator americanus TaxID=51031 RepID=W2SV12_NECAM|nr:hypothetical protein NECAME_04270 [Necator americanus]ETN73584.1 hypothetical protein NECAME_04270 [Necator americanus]
MSFPRGEGAWPLPALTSFGQRPEFVINHQLGYSTTGFDIDMAAGVGPNERYQEQTTCSAEDSMRTSILSIKRSEILFLSVRATSSLSVFVNVVQERYRLYQIDSS